MTEEEQKTVEMVKNEVQSDEIAAQTEQETDDTPDFGVETDQFDESDIKKDRLNLAQNSGVIGKNFKPGTWVYNQSDILANPGEALQVTLLQAEKYFMEDLPYTSTEQAQIALTEEIMKEKGGSLEWTSRIKPTWKRMVNMNFLIKLEKSEFSETFGMEAPDGGLYITGWFTPSLTSYKEAGMDIITRTVKLAKVGKPCYMNAWLLDTEEKSGDNPYFVAIATALGNHNEEMISWITEISL